MDKSDLISLSGQVIYKRNKEMLWDFLNELHHPMYIEKLSKPNYKEL